MLKAWFKATRETVGISQSDFAAIVGVRELTVKRWEKQGYNDPPSDAVEALEELRDRQREVVEFAIAKAEELRNEAGKEPDTVYLSYYRSQEEFEFAKPNESGSYAMANANSRLVAAELERLGYDVDFVYPATV